HVVRDCHADLRHLHSFPTRRSSDLTPDGFSGGIYPDQIEIDFKDIGQPDEYTTVTGRKRRIFTLSLQQLAEASFYCCPDEIFLRSEEHTSELQSRENLVCRLLLEKK